MRNDARRKCCRNGVMSNIFRLAAAMAVPLLMLVIVAAGLTGAEAVAATTYYVDFDGGSDDAPGTSANQPFKRAPGDPAAAGQAAATKLEPGDRVIFKGGVHYRGNLQVKWSGTAEAPIVYDGNTEGSFGEGRAILDGSERVDNWQQCKSAEECGGNSNWRNIYTARIPAGGGISALTVNLVQGEEMLYAAQYPNPEDPFYGGNPAWYRSSPARPSRTALVDEHLKEIGRQGLLGARVFLWTEQNHVEYQPIQKWDAQSATIEYPRTQRQPTGRYAIANSLHDKVFDRPGEYVFVEQAEGDEKSHRVYVWPWNNEHPDKSGIGYAVRGTAMDFGATGVQYVTVEGLRIQNYRRGITGRGARGKPTQGIVIRNNDITRIRTTSGSAISFVMVKDHLIEGNQITYCQDSNAVMTRIGERVIYRNNKVVMVGRSPMRFYDIQHGQMIGNTILDCKGVHSNALTIYVGCKDILVTRNVIHRSDRALTLQNAQRIYVINNVFTDPSTAVVGLWPGNPTQEYYFLNNFIGLTGEALFVNTPAARKMVIKNNIISGLGGFPLDESSTLSHNVYVGAPARLNEGEFLVSSLDVLAQDVGSDDYRPLPTGVTIDMGTDVSEYYPRETFPDFKFDTDIAGKPRRHGGQIDLGPYEVQYAPGALAGREKIVTGEAAMPRRPIDDYQRVEDAKPIIIRARDFSGQGGGEVRLMPAERQATSNFIKHWNVEGHWLEYSVDAPEAGHYQISLRYASDLEAPRRVSVNGALAEGLQAINLAVTGGWEAWRTTELPAPVSLKAGKNILRLTSLGGRGCNLDEIRLTRKGLQPIVISAGDFSAEGGAENTVTTVPSPRHGLVYTWNDVDHWLEWTIDDAAAGVYEVRLRYATLMNSPRSLSVNGQLVKHLEAVVLPRTSGWRVCNEESLPAPIELKAGRNVLRMNSVGGAGFNLDEIRLLPLKPAE